jgi:hypothetical protein
MFATLFAAGVAVFVVADLVEVGARSLTTLNRAGSVAGGLRFLLPFALYIFLASFLVALVSVGVADSTAGIPVSVGSMWRGVGPVLKEVIAANLLAVVVALTLIVLLAFFPILFLPLFFGPPLVVQTVALERRRLQQALPRVRALARGQLARTLMSLFCIALGARLFQGLVLDGVIACRVVRPRRSSHRGGDGNFLCRCRHACLFRHSVAQRRLRAGGTCLGTQSVRGMSRPRKRPAA